MSSPPTDRQPPPEARLGSAKPLWRSRRLWHPIGYTFTGLWMLGVLLVTGGNSRHPLFDFIFAVPLAAWVLGVLASFLINRRFTRP